MNQGFSISVVLKFGTRRSIIVKSCPVHCRLFNSIPGFHPLDASSTAPCCDNKNVSGHYQVSPGQKNLTWLRTTAVDSDMFGASCGVCMYVCVTLCWKYFGETWVNEVWEAIMNRTEAGGVLRSPLLEYKHHKCKVLFVLFTTQFPVPSA